MRPAKRDPASTAAVTCEVGHDSPWPRLDEAGAAPVPAVYEAAALSCGATVPGTRYRIEGWLGEGGMGSVYEAVHLDIDRRAAIKMLHAQLTTSPELVSMFRDEARAASKIGSPYIVDVIDFVALSDGRLMYVMELLEGASLHAEATRGGIDPGRLVGILRQACKGLAAAHDAGIVHRDIKPANLWMQRFRDLPDQLKLMDFGIAAFGASPEAAASRRGTPYYMAPEQIEGRAFDGRLDVYALGCTAYRLVTGRPPFVRNAQADVLQQHLTATPRPLGDVCTERELPEPIGRVVMRCLAKKPDERYADMRELEAAVCEAQIEAGLSTPWDGLTVPEVAPERRVAILAGLPDPANPRPRSRAFLTGGAAGAVATVAALTAWLALGGEPDAEVRGRVELLVQEARAAAARAHFVYPPVDNPEQPTAYLKLLDLEREAPDLGRSAADAAQALREEFAQTLTELGDRYWDEPHGRPFAADYYAQALVFDDDSPHARDRTGISVGQLAVLADKAQAAQFSALELAAVEPLVVLAEPDVQRRTAGLRRLLSGEQPRALSATSAVERLVAPNRAAATQTERRIAKAPSEVAATVTPLAPAAVETADEGGGRKGEGRGPSNRTKVGAQSRAPDAPASPRRDPVEARKLAKGAQTAFDGGDWKRAQQGFQAALALDPQCAPALGGLADLYFEKNQMHRAVRYARKATRAAPRDAAQHLRLGDAYYGALRFAEARDAYKRASKLGHPKARGRLERAENRLAGAQ